mgnify:CR=1 FL=1
MICDFNLDNLKFDEKGLIPAVVTESDTGKLLTLAYMNRESLEISIKEERTCFWSRSRQELWRKGETSGNCQHIVRITADCDMDALQIVVKKDGPACHTGEDSCFHKDVCESEELHEFTLQSLMDMLIGRKINKKEGSYTTYLFEKGIDKILKKLGEEATEIVIAAKNPDPEEIKYEISDFLYHMMVLMEEKGVTWEEITEELAKR